jgi:uncharacterized protein (DUF952 family)
VAGSYSARSLEEEGFIHCSTAEQLLPVANAFYRDVAEPIVLHIEPDRLSSPLRWERPFPADAFASQPFPHVYGPIDLDAVIRVTGLERSREGGYTSF